MSSAEKNPLQVRLATLSVHPADRAVLDRIAKRFCRISGDGKGCLLLGGSANGQGRPRIWVDGVNTKCAKLIVAIRDGKPWYAKSWQTRHLCDNPACVNPDHLTCGNAQDDADDRVRAGTTTRGERNRHAKLLECEARTILHSSGTYAEIGKRFGVSAKHVGKIKRGEAWGYLQAELSHSPQRGGSAGISVCSAGGQSDGS